MNAQHDAILNRVREWAMHAKADLDAAKVLLSAGSDSPSIAAFHAQQCAEKALKAFLVRHEVDFPYTHDIRRLLDLCESNNAHWAVMLRETERLTYYGVTARYPGIGRSISRSEASEAIRLAEQTLNQALQALEIAGFKL